MVEGGCECPSLFSVPRVGVGVVIVNDGKILVGERIGSIGAKTFALPGGHLEFGETMEECARRETEEETGLILDTVRFGIANESVMQTINRHYITIFMIATLKGNDQVPQVKEADKCTGWIWVNWNSIPKPVFQPLETLLNTNWKPEELQA